MLRRRKGFFAVVLVFIMCFSQSASLCASEMTADDGPVMEKSAVTEESTSADAASETREGSLSDGVIPSEPEAPVTEPEKPEGEISDNEPEEGAINPISEDEAETGEVSDNETAIKPVSEDAAGGESIIWEDYSAIRYDDELVLELVEYNGNASSITVPATAQIDGKTYRIRAKTHIMGDWLYHEERSIWYVASCKNLRNIAFEEGFKADEDSRLLFKDCASLNSIDLTNFDTSEVTDMTGLFSGCSGLTSLDVSKFDTSKVTNMNGMFAFCSGLTNLDVTKFDTSKCTNLAGMFVSCNGLTSLDVSKFDTSNCWTMAGMFSDCSKLTSIDVSKFDTSNCGELYEMFDSCSSLTSLNVSNFDTSSCHNMKAMFVNCKKLTSLDVSGFDTSGVENMSYMFAGCEALENLDVSKFDTSSVTNMAGMFGTCYALKNIDVSKFDTSKVKYMDDMFHGCRSLTSIDLRGFDTSHIQGNTVAGSFRGMAGMFEDCSKLTSLDVSRFDTHGVTGMAKMFSGCSSLETLDLRWFDTQNVVTVRGMFSGCDGLAGLDLSHFDTGSCQDMAYMFYNCNSLTSLDLSNFKTSEVLDMEGMFEKCKSLQSLDISSFDTSKVDDMHSMFKDCGELESLNLGSFNTSKVENMKEMFMNCRELESLGLGSFNTSKVKDMENMFYLCSSLKSLDLRSFDTSNVQSMSEMFLGCSALENLDVSSFDTSRVENMYWMFCGCHDLKRIDSSNFETPELKNMEGMFISCSSLESLDLSKADTSKVVKMSAMFKNCQSLTNLDLSNFDTSSADTDQMFYDTPSLNNIKTPKKTGASLIKLCGKYSGDEYENITQLPINLSKSVELTRTGSLAITEFKKLIDTSTVLIGHPKTLEYFVTPDNADYRVSWSNSRPDVATVDRFGTVTGLKPGTVTITANSVADPTKKVTWDITVSYENIISISLIPTSRNLYEGERFRLKAVNKAKDPGDSDYYIDPLLISWNSLDPAVASVDEKGMLTAHASGNARIKGIYKGDPGVSADSVFIIHKKDIQPTPRPGAVIRTVTFMSGNEVFLSWYVEDGQTVPRPEKDPVRAGAIFGGWLKGRTLWNFTMPVHSDMTLCALFKDENMSVSSNTGSGMDTIPTISDKKEIYLVKGQSYIAGGKGWSTEDRTVASVAAKTGKITGKKKGKTTVTNGTDTYTVFVAEPVISDKKQTVFVGQTKKISLSLNTYEGKDEDRYPVTWYSSNPRVAIVFDGEFKALAKGSVNISAYAGGKAYTSKVTVTDTYKAPGKFKEADAKFTMNPLQTVTLKYDASVFRPKNAVWSGTSENAMTEIKNKNGKLTGYRNGIVEITSAGKIKAIGKGSTFITGKDTKGNTVTLTISVNPVSTKEATYIFAGKSEIIKFPKVNNRKADWWKSSAPYDIEVDTEKNTGKVTAHSGSGVVSCSYNGFEFSTTVYTEDVKSIDLKGIDPVVGKIGRAEINGNVNQTVYFKSSNPKVAFVDENGFIYFRAPGTVYISAKINGKTYKTSKIKVREK